jgi:hypothetical protein
METVRRYSVKPVIAVGNGESRINIDLSTTINDYTVVGCNAICRDYPIEHLVCVDRRMVREGIYHYAENIYTRNDWAHEFQNTNVQPVPDLPYTGALREDEPFQWGSGPYAVLIAAHLAESDVYMIGFDLYSKDRKVNNVYKGTENYVRTDSHEINPKYWIHQISKVIEHFPNITFTVFVESDWHLPKSWEQFNLKQENIGKFITMANQRLLYN